MSLITYSSVRSRVYVRRFDHDEARERYEAGESVAALAACYGVTYGAVYRIVKPGVAARELEANRRWRTGVCEDCGGPAMRLVCGKKEHNPDGATLCLACRKVRMRTRFLFDEHGTLLAVRCDMIDCANGERWQPPSHFTRGYRYHDLREGGIHSVCRACQTRNRRRWREQRKVPCSHGCGTLVLHENRGKAPECRACAHRRIHESRRNGEDAQAPKGTAT